MTVATPGRTAPRGGLLAAANVIDSADPHILQGVTYVPDGCDIPLLTPGSCWVTEVPVETEKTFEGIGDPVSSTVTFVLHAGVECFIGLRPESLRPDAGAGPHAREEARAPDGSERIRRPQSGRPRTRASAR